MPNETAGSCIHPSTPLDQGVFSKRETQELDKLFSALSKAQKALRVAKKDSSNPFFKSVYADLVSVIKASRDALCDHGLSILQRLDKEEGRLVLLTRLCHSSGQWIESAIDVNPTNSNIQTLGSYLTYLKRYAYAAIVGVVASDEDDDGEKAAQDERKTTTVEEFSELEKIRG